MNSRYVILLLFVVLLVYRQCNMSEKSSHPFYWDTDEAAAKPWTRWWWFGSAVNQEEITRQLRVLKESGFGGVEIQPIYTENPSPIPSIPYLSERWAEVFRYTLEEAERLELGVDLTLGSGWPFGGPWLEPQHAARKLDIEKRRFPPEAVSRIIAEEDRAPIECVLLYSKETGVMLEPTVTGARKTWTVPRGDHTVYIVRFGYTGQDVKRAAVGSEGPALDHFSRAAFRDYARPFETVLQRTGGLRPRSNFNDSYEVYGADCTPELFDAFKELHQYDLRPYIPLLISASGSGLHKKLLHDYRETINLLYTEGFCSEWKNWSRENGMKIKFQAHGSPGNLIDLYGLSDIPETEGFGRYGIRIIEGKFSSSAAHLYNRKLCSSETFTWLDEHFHVSLDMMKRAVDYFYLAGINHVFYHGTPFSPKDDPYPGPVFYASTHAGETNTWWPHVKHFNEYMTRIQAPLQNARFDADVALYFPAHDSWRFAFGHGVEFDSVGKSVPTGTASLLQLCEVNRSEHWFQEPAPLTWEAANLLQEGGWQYDYISDKVISEIAEPESGSLNVNGMRYKAVIFAGCHEAEQATLDKIAEFLENGVTVIFIKGYPAPVDRRPPAEMSTAPVNPYEARFRKYLNTSCFFIESESELPGILESKGIQSEPAADTEIKFIRYRNERGTLYFLKNPTDAAIRRRAVFRTGEKQLILGNPLTSAVKTLPVETGANGISCDLEIGPHAALLLLATDKAFKNITDYPVLSRQSEIPVSSPFHVTWHDYEGNSHSKEITRLTSWTEWPETALYSGELTYETTFTASGDTEEKHFILNMGSLHNSAEVYVNDHYAGAVWTEPFTLDITGQVVSGENRLELKVRNLMANRIIDIDRKGAHWRKFFFVNIDYESFDASGWEALPSGLLGPVSISVME